MADENPPPVRGAVSSPYRHSSKDALLKGAMLTQTIVHSPIIKWILPARIRSPERNDVVFVGTKSVEVKEALPEGRLLDVMKIIDFPGPILAAKVLNITEALPLESRLQSDTSWNGPAQILVLSVDMKELRFVYIPPGGTGYVSLCRPLPQGASADIRYGKHLAVDPKSRAVAISASRDFFGIMKLKSPRETQREIQDGELDLISEEAYFKVDGMILFLEFLYPQSANDKSVLLLLILQRSDHNTYAVTYKWDEDGMSREPTIHEFKLARQYKLPSMIVPLTKQTSFLVVSTTEMAVYSSDGSSRPRKYPFIAPAPEISAASMWTRWARPARNWLYSQRHDGIYLCREDGWIYLLEFGNEGDLESQVSLGQIHCDVDMAFDVLDMGHEGGDFILAAGSTGDAGLFVQEARDSPKCVQQFLNWAPIRDAAMVLPESTSTARGGMARNRLFACSESSAGRGALHEFRWGIEAVLGIQVPLEDWPNIRDMWTMLDEQAQNIYVLLSDPTSTIVLRTDALQEEICMLEDDQTGLSRDATLAAGFGEGALVQITEQATHIFCPHNTDLNTLTPHDENTKILAVAVHGSELLIPMVVRRHRYCFLSVNEVIVDDNDIHLYPGELQRIQEDPVSVTIERFGDMVFVFVGNKDGAVNVFLKRNNYVTWLFETKIRIQNNEDFSMVIESLAVIKIEHERRSLRAFFLCGLRSGFLVPFEIDFNGSGLIDLKQKEIFRAGTTSVRLRGMGPYAMMACGDELWHVSYSPDCIPSECFIRQVLIVDRHRPGYLPGGLFGFGTIHAPNFELGRQPCTLFCFAHQELLICHWNTTVPKMVPRRIELPGNPKRLTYSPTLQCLIASYETLEIESEEAPLDKTVRSYVQFIDPDSQSAQLDRDQSWTPESSRGETVTSILDWPCERKGNKYHLVAIGTRLPIINKDNDSLFKGRLVVLCPRRDRYDPSRINALTKFIRPFEDPIRALAKYEDCLIVAAGHMLYFVSPRDARLNLGSIQLASPAVALTVYGNEVCVMTLRHSWIVYHLRIPPGGGTPEFSAREHATIMRDGLSQLVHPGGRDNHFTFLTSYRGGRIEARELLLRPDQARPMEAALQTPHPCHQTHVSESVLRFIPKDESGGPFFGITMQGTVVRLIIPEPNALPLLKLLQNICSKDESISPSLRKWQRRRPLDDLSDPSIDGDILARLAVRGSPYLEELVIALDSDAGDSSTEDLLNKHAPQVAGKPSTDAVIGWLRRYLDISL